MGRLPDDTQLLALGLLSAADDEGYFRADPAIVRADAAPFRENIGRISEMIRELVDCEWIEVFEHPVQGPIGRVVSWLKHQKIYHPTPSKLRPYFSPESFPKVSRNIPEPFGASRARADQGSGNREQGAGKGNGSASEDSEPIPAPSIDDVSGVEVLSLAQVKAAVMTTGIPNAFVDLVYDAWIGRAGKDGAGVPVRITDYVRKRWNRESTEWKNGTHRDQQKNSAPQRNCI